VDWRNNTSWKGSMTETLRSIRRGPATPERVLVLLPGYGDMPEPFLDRVTSFDPNEQWLVVVVEPQTPSERGPYWYDVDENGPDPVALAAALASIDALCASLLRETGLSEDALVIVGFSQGGALALAHLVDPTSTMTPSAVATLAAYLPSRDEELIDLSRASQRPILFAHGEDDELIEPIRGRSASKAFHRANAVVSWVEVSGGHRFDTPLTDELSAWLDALSRGEEPHAPPI
jgi:phospholipase/carboxylesterase